jgi:hypothetical protein
MNLHIAKLPMFFCSDCGSKVYALVVKCQTFRRCVQQEDGDNQVVRWLQSGQRCDCENCAIG